MTEIIDTTDTPVLSFKTKKRETKRPEIEFELDDRMVTARAPKASWWTRLWLAQTTNNAVELYSEFRSFLTIALGPEVAGWLRTRENDLNDPYDLPDMIELVEFLADRFEPLLRDEFAAAGTSWQRIAPGAAGAPVGRPAAGTSAAKPRKAAAKKTAGRRG